MIFIWENLGGALQMTLLGAVFSHPEERPVRNTCYISTLTGNTLTFLSSDFVLFKNKKALGILVNVSAIY